MEILTRAALVLTLFVASAQADWTAKRSESAPPDALSPAIAAALPKTAIQVLQDDKPQIEIWLRDPVPLKRSTASLNSIAETTLVGAVSIHSNDFSDYKGNAIPSGVYTARFALQPQDGDHLGTADYGTFLALIPAKADQEVEGISKYTPMVKASGKITPSGHPAVISLRPVSRPAAALPAITEPAPDHRAVQLKLSGKPSDGDKVEIPFDLVFEGHGGAH